MIKSETYKFKGINRDLSNSNANKEYAYEIRNLRLTVDEENTLLSFTNVRDLNSLNVKLQGSPIGYAVVDNILIVFSTDKVGKKYIKSNETIINEIVSNIETNFEEPVYTETRKDTLKSDYIYKFIFNKNGTITSSFISENFNFDPNYPIETLIYKESDSICKVYWTDGLNRPRLININDINSDFDIKNNSIEFIPDIKENKETITITTTDSFDGFFPAGTLQYAFSYVNYYGQQSNIFYTSPLYYTVGKDRSLSVDKNSSLSYSIDIKDLDSTYEYVRIYSMLRTSQDSAPHTKAVADVKIVKNEDTNSIFYVDKNNYGQSINFTDLLYIGGEQFIFHTMTQKDNTLFFGNIEQVYMSFPEDIKNLFIKGDLDKNGNFIGNATYNIGCTRYKEGTQIKKSTIDFSDTHYVKDWLLKEKSSEEVTVFKYGETYRLGIQFQYKSGKWTTPIYLDDVINDIPPVGDNEYFKNKVNIIPSVFKIMLRDTLIAEIKKAGYIKARPVIVYPEFQDRTILCQGYLCPTVYNAGDRIDGSVYAQSSWFVRPNWPYDVNADTEDKEGNKDYTNREDGNSKDGPYRQGVLYANEYKFGGRLEFRHNHYIGGQGSLHHEILGADRTDKQKLTAYDNGLDYNDWKSQHSHQFFVDQSVVTMHSPELEFDDTFKTIDLSQYKFRIIGIVPMTGFYGDMDIIMEKGPELLHSDDNPHNISMGFHKEDAYVKNVDRCGFRSLCSRLAYRDSFTMPIQFKEFWYYDNGYNTIPSKKKKAFSEDIYPNYIADYFICPFHCSGNISNKNTEDKDSYSVLQYKKLSNLKFSSIPSFFKSEKLNTNNLKLDISDIKLFYSEEDSILQLENQNNNSKIYYKGNIDKIITSTYLDSEDGSAKSGVHKYGTFHIGLISGNVTPNGSILDAPFKLNNDQIDYLIKENKVLQNVDDNVNSPIIMRYKSSPHAVISLKNIYNGNNYKQTILPTLIDDLSDTRTQEFLDAQNISDGKKGINNAWYSSDKPLFWEWNKTIERINGYNQQIIDYNFEGTTLSGGDRKNFGDITRFYGPEFGWLWLGELYRDKVENRFGGTSDWAISQNKWIPCGESVVLDSILGIELYATEGDTYFQRYDNIKTYPWSLTEVNGITEIMSFMVETRINLQGRYDSNIGSLTNFHVSPKNFNLINKAYTQQNNLFSSYSFNYDTISETKFPNLISWSKTKTSGELVDNWTNLTLASTLETDGVLGKITAIKNFNDGIIVFQEQGISQVLYNEQTQIAPSIGVPIEIANSGKVTGKRTISNSVGCQNKWSICQTVTGMYFVDSFNKDIYRIGSEGLENLSANKGLHTYVKKYKNLNSLWHPEENSGIHAFYDKNNKEVLFKMGKEFLVYSEQLQQFTSLYDTSNTIRYIFPMQDKIIAMDKNDKDFELFNYDEGTKKPYSISFISNPNPLNDKTFNNIEFRCYVNNSDTLQPFTKIKTDNEFQSGEEELTYSPVGLSNLKKRFNIWRANIPRANKSEEGYGFNRIRNPWCKITLEYASDSEIDITLHDFVVYYNI